MNAIVKLNPLALRGEVTKTAWILPPDMDAVEWTEAGEQLGRVDAAVHWWIGDWWAFGEHRYGDRKAIVSADGWEGPAFDACASAARVARDFESCRRRQVLGFTHHREVAGFTSDEADALLDWCEETIEQTGKPRSTRELRGEINRRRVTVGAQPSSETCTITDLFTLAESGAQFGCIYADPPWLYSNQGTRASTQNHYKGLTVDQICALPVKTLAAEDSHLHLWTTNGFLFEAPRIFDAWGFEFKSSLVWIKRQMGIGNYWRNSHEIMLTAVRGDAKRFNDHSLMSWLECDRGKHSSKPEQVPQMLERASPGPRLELFGRLPRQGWTVWGNQIERNLFMPENAA